MNPSPNDINNRSVKSLGTTTINGVEIDLYLLFQIVLSHGGFEKVNWRNEWDSLLRHFKLPRATNGGLAIKGIYTKNLQLYEKILGEDADLREESEEDFEDFRHRRRYAVKATNSPAPSAPSNPLPHYPSSAMIPEHMRIQHGLSTDLASVEYEKLILTLQSPLPNEQDMAISVCTLLSNDTKHVLVLPKAPQLLNLLLAHAGLYNHCGLRHLMEETYINARGLSHSEFWKNSLPAEYQELLCERFILRRTKCFDMLESPLGEIKETLSDSPIPSVQPSLPESDVEQCSMDTTEINDLKDGDVSQGSTVPSLEEKPEVEKIEQPEIVKTEPEEPKSVVHYCEAVETECCTQCPCARGFISDLENDLPFVVRGGQADTQIEDRINQIATILRNLSFEDNNAEVMAANPTFLRYLVVSMTCENSTLSTSSWDILGNIARFLRLNDPMEDPISAIIFSLVVDGLFSVDRFRILHSLETIRDLVKFESNEEVVIRYFESKIYTRICQLLTISDIMLLIYTLECILSITNLGDAVCNEIVRVQGSVAALVSLVTVEAQSYGPKGCILMRVVETVTGNPQHSLAFQAAKKQLLKQTDQAATQGTGCPPQQIQLTTITQGQTSQILVNANSPIPPPQQQHSPHTDMTTQPMYTTPSSTIRAVHHPPIKNPSWTGLPPSTSPVQNNSKWTPGNVNVVGFNANNLPSASTSPNTGSSVGTTKIPPPSVSPSLDSGSNSPTQYNTRTPTNPSSPTTPKGKTRNQQKKANAAAAMATTSTTTTAAVGSTADSGQNSQPPSFTGKNLANSSSENSLAGATTQDYKFVSTVPPAPLTQTVSSLPSGQNAVTPRGALSEDAWALAWLKGSFDIALGTSIEQGEIYRMYCAARKNPCAVLSVDQFVHCVKCAYGTSVGPVIKQFGSSSLSFLEGIRPKMAIQNSGNAGNNSMSINSSGLSPSVSPIPSMPSGCSQITTTTTPASGPSGLSTQEPSAASHIPSTEKKTFSPILKATLSQPPKPKIPAGVTQRQQKKLQPAEKTLVSKGSGGKDGKKGGKKKCGKPNGIDGGALGPEELSASSSVNSTASSDSINPPQLISFHNVLHNGLSSEDSSKDSDLTLRDELDDIKNQNRLKGMLVDLLEKKVKPREAVNGVVGNREIRISEKGGLELVDKMLLDPEGNNSNSSASNASMLNNAIHQANDSLTSVFNAVIDGSDSSSQQMTFYSSSESQVTFQGRISNLKNNSSATATPVVANTNTKVVYSGNETVVMSGGGGNGGRVGGSNNGNGNNSDGFGSGGGGGGFDNVNSGGSNADKELNIDALDSPGDLFDKFNEISDLIMVPPEQLGIKRSHSTDEANSGESQQPPLKKAALSNGTGSTCPTPPPVLEPQVPINPTPTFPVLQATMNKSGVISSVKSTTLPNHVGGESEVMPNAVKSMPVLQNSTIDAPPGVTTVPVSVPIAQATPNVGAVTTTATTIPVSTAATGSAQGVMQVPLRFANSNQLTFTRQLVLPSGQPIVWKSGNQLPTPLQGQVLLSSKPSNSSTDPNQIPKAIIILQQPQPQRIPNSPGGGPTGETNPNPPPQQQQQQQQQPAQPQVQLYYQTNSGGQPTSSSSPHVATTSNVSRTTTATNVNMSAITTTIVTTPATTSTVAHKTNIQNPNHPPADLDAVAPYICEWAGCGVRFTKYQEVYFHAARAHCPESLTDAVRCEWGSSRCDPTLRKRLSLMTHLQDRHCSKPALELANFKRKSKIVDYQPPPAQPIQHPGYAPNAAFHAIKRHAVQYTNPKELLDDNEGPVTKSIRLTAALILKNLCSYSSAGRRLLREHESNLAGIAMSNVESSRTIAQLLYDMSKRS